MEYFYYVTNSAVAIVIMLILNFKFLHKKHTLPENKDYVLFLNSVLVFYTTDLVWGSLLSQSNIMLIHIVTAIHYVAMAFTVGLGCRYVATFLQLRRRVAQVLKIIGLSYGGVMLIGLVVNEYVPIIFSVDKQGSFHTHMMCHLTLLAMAAMYLTISFASRTAQKQHTGTRKRRFNTIYYFTLIMALCIISQILNPIAPFYSLGLTIGTLLIHVYIHEDEMEMANQAKSVFLNNMSHDIRTPMNAIMGFAELMEKEKNNPEILTDYLKKIKSSGQYLMTLINNVLDMARIESGEAIVEEDFFDFEDPDMRIITIFNEQMRQKNLSFKASMNVEHRYVAMDRTKVNEIIANLLSNAIKYTPEGGSVTLTCNELPSSRIGYAKYQLQVADTGIGMSEEFQKHIFESFSRERTTTESRVVGTGLGMSIVKKLVDLMGGAIQVESQLGKGSTFTITQHFRIWQNPEKHLEQHLNNDLPHTFQMAEKRILLAEDNDLNAEIAIALLSDLGIKLERAANGEECVQMLTDADEGYYDLILMDVQMPILDGYSASRKVRAMENPHKAHIPIVAMTANAFAEDKNLALDAGMNAYITKPIDVALLTQTLHKVFEHSKTR